MAIFDTLFTLMFNATFVIAPLGGIACAIVMVGLWRNRRQRP